MRILGNIFGIVGLIGFIFGIISYALTQTASFFFYLHIFGGLILLLVYFVMIYRGSKSFLGLMLLLILSVLSVIISGTSENNVYFFAVPAAILFIAYIAFNFDIVKVPKKVPYLVVPVAIVAAGLIFKPDLDIGEYYVYLIGLGGILIVAHSILNFGKIREGVFGRSTKYAANVLVYSFIFMIIIIVINALAYNVDWKKDFTQNKINLLSEQTDKILKNLETEVTITPFYVEKNPNKAMLKDLLGMYSSKSHKLKVEFVDPDVEPHLAKKHNTKDGDILVMSEGEETILTEPSEQAITSAIMKVTRSTKVTVCFTSGHGEMSLDSEEAEGISAVAGGLKNEGYDTKTLKSLLEAIPSECNIVTVAGPRTPFSKAEAKIISDYLQGGGKGLFLLDPRIPDTRLKTKMSVLSSGLEGVALKNGAELGNNFVLEKHLQLFAGMTLESSVHSSKYSDHPITEPLDGKNTFFPGSVRSVTKNPGTKGYDTTELIFSAAGKGMSWAEYDIDRIIKSGDAQIGKGDIKGPVSIAVASEKKIVNDKKDDVNKDRSDATRSVWVGNSSFVSNGFIRTREFNYDLVLNMLSWLWGEEEKISIRPKRLKTSTLLLTPEQSNLVFYISVLTIPEIILIFGLVIWLRRRKK